GPRGKTHERDDSGFPGEEIPMWTDTAMPATTGGGHPSQSSSSLVLVLGVAVDALGDLLDVPAAVRAAVTPRGHGVLGLLLVPAVVVDQRPRDQPVQRQIVHDRSLYRPRVGE